MYQAAIQGLLGLRRRGNTFSINPCIPAMWPGYSMEWRIGHTTYRITVTNPAHLCRGVESAELDGVPVDSDNIPIREDDAIHDVAVVLGKRRRPDLTAPAAIASERGGVG
jgi:cellobiose phosphorylase